MDSSGELFLHSREGYFGLFPKLQSNTGNKHQNITQVSAEKVYHKCTYIISFVTWHNGPINDDIKTVLTNQLNVHLLCLHSADDITNNYRTHHDCDTRTHMNSDI